MNTAEYATENRGGGLFSWLFGKTIYVLVMQFESDSVETVDQEVSAAKDAIRDWVATRRHKAVTVTASGPQTVCDAIEQQMTKLCREEPQIAPLLRDILVAFSFNGKQQKYI